MMFTISSVGALVVSGGHVEGVPLSLILGYSTALAHVYTSTQPQPKKKRRKKQRTMKTEEDGGAIVPSTPPAYARRALGTLGRLGPQVPTIDFRC